MRTRPTWQTGAAAAAAVATVLLATACTSSQPSPTTSKFSGATTPSGSWAYPNGDLEQHPGCADTTISSANVASLREAWSFHLTGTAAAGVNGAGSFAATPVVVNGDRVRAGPGRERLRDLARHRQAALGVHGQRAGGDRAGPGRGGGRGRRRVRGHVHGGLRAERGHREGDLDRRTGC